MTNKNNVAANAAPATECADPANAPKPSKKRLRASSEAHEKPASRPPAKNAGHTASAKAPAAGDASNTMPEQPRPTKASVVVALLTRQGGASLEALCEANRGRWAAVSHISD